MSASVIDTLMLAKALAIANDEEATVAQLEWVRKFLNDYEHRHREDGWRPDDPAKTALDTYGPMDFDDLPINTQGVTS